MLFIFKPCVATFYVFFYVPYSPLGFFSPLEPFQCFHQWDCTIQIESVHGTMVYCGHDLVCVNEFPTPSLWLYNWPHFIELF
jgi:hypothetical protein